METESCFKCSLCYNRTYQVKGDGNVNSEVMIIADKPSYSDDKHDTMYNGRVGKFLDKELRRAGLVRSADYYITTLVKCRPAMDVELTNEQIKMCSYIFKEEFNRCKPKVIFTLGGKVAESVFGKPYAIKNLRYKIIGTRQCHVICTYHPSAIMKDETGELIHQFRADIELLVKYIAKFINPYVK